ncbi:beta-lactamase/transpeptidase-like protein [Leucogyrophana mollusca]|uniref:Beta-lactamase/transpeptidase-like protein n=1 Tax=Leucogyrophana mollusca TaxID=85980 RepID=A0ACB8BPF6_9AGAM|nr:beta-lactamase/transpeptidase-like protein [Leucogyrophana mollusca]
MRHNWSIPGLSLAVVRPDGGVEFGGWGIKSEGGKKVTSDTIFFIGQCTKAFTVAALGILIDDFASGKNITSLPSGLATFDWDTKVKNILPGDWKLMDEGATEKATIRDILAHVSGQPAQDLSYATSDSPIDVIRNMRHIRPAFELREKFHYTNHMYILASYIISKYSGMSLHGFVKMRIFIPLNMTSTTYSFGNAVKSGEMTQGWTSFGRRVPPAVDMAKWTRCLLNSGVDVVTNRTVIPLSAFKASTAAQVIIGEERRYGRSLEGYGLGWFLSSYFGHDMVSHPGDLPGFSSQVAFFPQDQLGIVILVNADSKRDSVTQITDKVLNDVLALNVPVDIMPKGEDSRSKRPETPQTTNLPPIPLQKYAGMYSSPGYQNLTFCDPSSQLPYCKRILGNYARIDPTTRSQDITKSHLVSTWPGCWTREVHFEHREDNLFRGEFARWLSYGYGANATAFQVEVPAMLGPDIVASFVVEDSEVVGFGLFGTEGFETKRQRSGRTVREKADVWFDKVSDLSALFGPCSPVPVYGRKPPPIVPLQ